MKVTPATLALLVAIGWSAGTASAGLDSRLKSVGNLVDHSSAARKIESSSNDAAKAKLQAARDMWAKAQQAAKSGNDKQSAKLLTDATKTLFAAARLIPPELTEKKKRDYNDRKASIGALLETHHRVAEEKKQAARRAAVESEVNTLVNEAETQAKAGKYVEGRATLDKAYEKIKVSLEQLRGGDTLVRSLDFKTKKEEYEYYVAKVDSQLTAIGMFRDKIQSGGKQRMVDSITKKANEMISQGKNHADKGEYEAAIPYMEKALGRLQSGLMMVVN